MKRILAVAFLFCFAGAAYAQSPIKLSLFDEIAWPKSHHTNVVLGLVDNNTPQVIGLDFNLISARADDMIGLQSAFVYTRAITLRGVSGALYTVSNDVVGVQWGLLNVTSDILGVQWGLVNVSNNYLAGLQLGAINFAETLDGVQCGVYNETQTFTGLQLGLINNTTYMKSGLQIGLLNIIKSNGWLPAMIIVNGRF